MDNGKCYVVQPITCRTHCEQTWQGLRIQCKNLAATRIFERKFGNEEINFIFNVLLFSNVTMDAESNAPRLQQKKKRGLRQNSNIFAMFDQQQITEFKEAFSMIDHDRDGFIDKEDLKDMLSSLGNMVRIYKWPIMGSRSVANGRIH